MGFEEYFSQTFGEPLNRGLGQSRVVNERGTYVPDTQTGAEIKGVQYQSLDSQMKVALLDASPSQPLRLYVLADYTTFSQPFQEYIDNGSVIVVPVKLPVS